MSRQPHISSPFFYPSINDALQVKMSCKTNLAVFVQNFPGIKLQKKKKKKMLTGMGIINYSTGNCTVL